MNGYIEKQTMGQLSLTVPAQSVQDRQDKITARELESWLNDLPQVNLAKAFTDIGGKLYQLNRLELPPSLRMELQATIESAVEHLKQHLRPEDYKKNPELKAPVRQYHQEKTFTYKIIIQEAILKPRKMGYKNLVHQSLIRAITSLCEYSLFYYNDYQKLPVQIWNEATLLYRYARSEGVDLDATSGKFNEGISLNQAYQTYAALRISDPYQMQPGTIWALYTYFITLTDKLILDSGEPTQSKQVLAIIDKSPNLKEHDLLINIEPIYAQITADIALLETNAYGNLQDVLALVSSESLLQTLHRILSSLSSQIDRKSDRVQTHQRFEAAIGLAACCHLMQENMHSQSIESDEEQMTLSSDIKPDTSSRHYHTHACTSINRNAGGLALRIESNEHLPIHVGQVIGIHRPGTNINEGWVMGVCRWMTQHANQRTIDLGIQYISTTALPATVTTNNISKRKSPALASVQKQGNKQITTLITPAGFYKENKGLELHVDDQIMAISCQQLLESTASFERFIYQSASKIADIDTQQLEQNELESEPAEAGSE